MDPSKLLRASNDGIVKWNTTHCILPTAYRRVFFKVWDKVQYSTVEYSKVQCSKLK